MFALSTQNLLLGINTLLLLLLCWQHAWQHQHGIKTPPSISNALRPLQHVQPSILVGCPPAPVAPAPPPAPATSRLSELPLPKAQIPQYAPWLNGPASNPASLATQLVDVPISLLQLEFSTSEAHLKQIWRLERHPKGSRAASVELHNSTWAFLSKRQLARGVSSVGDPLRLQCFASKVLAGRPVRLSVVGGSVSFGTTFTTSRSKALFHWKVYQWINATFPGRLHEHYCGAVAASGPSYMEHCLHWHVPDNADLVLVEYAVNFDPGSDDVASFERMIRKLLRMRNQPAIILVNTMELMAPTAHSLHFSGNKQWLDGYSEGAPSQEDMSFEYRAPSEDSITQIAQYYGIPSLSLRSAIFRELKGFPLVSSLFPLKQVFHDRHHPGAWGHSLMAQMVVHTLKNAISDVATNGDHDHPQCDLLVSEGLKLGTMEFFGLGKPLFSVSPEAPIGSCSKGEEVMQHVRASKGFAYRVEGTDAKMKPGLVGMAAGDWVQLCVDISRLSESASFVVILGHLISYEHMGKVRISCLNECECSPEELDAHVQGGKFSVFKAKTIALKRARVPAKVSIRLSPRTARGRGATETPDGTGNRNAMGGNCSCVLHLLILPASGSGEHKFKILSLMTAQKEGSLRYGHQTGFNVRPMHARVS